LPSNKAVIDLSRLGFESPPKVTVTCFEFLHSFISPGIQPPQRHIALGILYPNPPPARTIFLFISTHLPATSTNTGLFCNRATIATSS
jgi:hypothetical protein